MTESLPRFIAASGNARAGLVHYSAVDQRWHAADWRGALGAFETQEEVVWAIRSAPPRPRSKRRPPQETPDAMKWVDLTDAANGCNVRSNHGRNIGAVLPAGERSAAWAHGVVVGEFETLSEAQHAVVAADRAKKKSNG